MAIAYKYAEDIHNNLRMYPAWPINMPLALGDYGTLENSIFQRIGNITDKFGIQFERISSLPSTHYDYRSANKIEAILKPRATIGMGAVSANASLDISFSGENAIFFNAAECSVTTYKDNDEVFDQLIDLYRQGNWDSSYKIITDIVNASSTTLIFSGGNNASISLEADTPNIDTIDLAKANIGLKIKNEKNIGLKIISIGGLTPLIRLAGIIKWPFLEPRVRQLLAENNVQEPVVFRMIG